MLFLAALAALSFFAEAVEEEFFFGVTGLADDWVVVRRALGGRLVGAVGCFVASAAAAAVL